MKPEFSQEPGTKALPVADASEIKQGASPSSGIGTGPPRVTQERMREPSKESWTASNSLALDRFGSARVIAILIGLLVVTAAAVFFAFHFFSGNTADSAAPNKSLAVVTVSTTQATAQPVDDILTVTGSVSAWDPLSVGAEVSGLRIKSVNVEEGDLVKKGQVLATLNSGLLEAQLAQSKALLRSTEASLRKSIQPNRPEEIRALEAGLKQAEATIKEEEAIKRQMQVTLDNADVNASRYKELASMGAISDQDAETKEVAAETSRAQVASSEAKISAARAALTQTREKLLEARNGGRQEDVQISQSTVEQTRAQIEQLQEQIEQTIIRAPDDGLISKRDAHIGDIVNSGKSLFSMIRLNRLELRAQVSDIDLAKFHEGQTVMVSTSEGNDVPAVKGTVWRVSPQVDASSRLGTVRVSLPANAGLKPGMFVRGEVSMGQRKSVTVPVDCVVTRNGEAFVFTLDGTKAVSHSVTTGVQTDKYIEVTQGLEAGQTVIAKGARFLCDRDIVRISQ